MNQLIESNLRVNTINNNNNSSNGKRLRLRRPNHSNELIQGLNQSLTEECFTDATLICDEKSIRVHRIVLSLFSQYFKRTFKLMSNTNSCHYPVIAIKSIPFLDLKAIIEFIYCGEVSIPKHQLNSLLKSAEDLEIEGLRSDNCKDFSPFNRIQSLENNSNLVSLSGNFVNNNNPIIASSLVSLPAQSLRRDFIPSPKRKYVKKVNNSVLNSNLSLIQTNSINSQLFNSNNNYYGNPSSLSIVNLIPVPNNNIKTYQQMSKTKRLKSINFVKTLNDIPKTLQTSEITSENEVSNTSSVSISSQLYQNRENECINREIVSKVNDLVVNSLNIVSKSGCEGLEKLYELSNDENRSVRKPFLDQLIAFHLSNGTPIAYCPTINKQPLDLFKLYLAVKEKGGYEKVTKDKLWIDCTDTCNVAHSTSAAYALKLHYNKHLLPFESKYDPNGIEPNILLKSVEKSAQQTQQKVNPQIQLNPEDSKCLKTETQNETVVKNTVNAKQIEEIWIEDEDESSTNNSKQVSEPYCSNHLISFADSPQNGQTLSSMPSTSLSNSNKSQTISQTECTESFEPQIPYNSSHKTSANKTSSMNSKIKANYPYMKCNTCKKEFVNHLLYNLHVKNNCKKTTQSLIRPNITL